MRNIQVNHLGLLLLFLFNSGTIASSMWLVRMCDNREQLMVGSSSRNTDGRRVQRRRAAVVVVCASVTEAKCGLRPDVGKRIFSRMRGSKRSFDREIKNPASSSHSALHFFPPIIPSYSLKYRLIVSSHLLLGKFFVNLNFKLALNFKANSLFLRVNDEETFN